MYIHDIKFNQAYIVPLLKYHSKSYNNCIKCKPKNSINGCIFLIQLTIEHPSPKSQLGSDDALDQWHHNMHIEFRLQFQFSAPSGIPLGLKPSLTCLQKNICLTSTKNRLVNKEIILFSSLPTLIHIYFKYHILSGFDWNLTEPKQWVFFLHYYDKLIFIIDSYQFIENYSVNGST